MPLDLRTILWSYLLVQSIRLQHLSVKSEGWLEIEMREIFNLGLEDGEVQLSVIEIKGGHWKSGFLVFFLYRSL